ncbi:MAG: phosphoglucosamine mutase [Candidatus Borkfalkiaceae bacterium]|nr:phosphoglucosamine mutase [Clostridia bacterium]MDY6223820.1 phosphoglucosamine mutase [Christensenellaceae bacterium]
MGLFFGTDGLRGKVNEDLTFEVAYKVGNALSILKERPTILVGGDTRVSRSYLTAGLAGGAMSGGANVIDAGVLPTAGVAYLTRLIGADYGVVISASHNGGEYNGIKVFDKNGYKLGDKEEERIERCFIHDKTNDFPMIGSYRQDLMLIKKYRDFLLSAAERSFKGKTIVLDCAFGAAHRIAPEVFRRAGASVIAANCVNDGLSINKNCGAVYPQNLARKVLRYKADMGFAFDGDADRVIAVDEYGEVIDGDMLLCALAKYFKTQGRLHGNAVVGTSHTNMAIENELKADGVDMIRTDIGDKYVLAKMREKGYSLGGEQSGHIILKEYATTGDGILTAIAVTNMLLKQNKTLSEGAKITLYPQVNKNVTVGDKFRVINNEELSRQVAKYAAALEGKGRLMIRASGTEPKIRVMVESKDEALNLSIADTIANTIEKINREE